MIKLIALVVGLISHIACHNIGNQTRIKQLKDITPLSSCSAKFDNGDIIDLTSLDNPSAPL